MLLGGDFTDGSMLWLLWFLDLLPFPCYMCSSNPLTAVSCACWRAVLPSALRLFVCHSTFVCSPLSWLWFLVLVLRAAMFVGAGNVYAVKLRPPKNIFANSRSFVIVQFQTEAHASLVLNAA